MSAEEGGLLQAHSYRSHNRLVGVSVSVCDGHCFHQTDTLAGGRRDRAHDHNRGSRSVHSGEEGLVDRNQRVWEAIQKEEGVATSWTMCLRGAGLLESRRMSPKDF